MNNSAQQPSRIKYLKRLVMSRYVRATIEITAGRCEQTGRPRPCTGTSRSPLDRIFWREAIAPRDDCVTALREGILAHKIEPHSDLKAGELVRITSGPLAGTEGILARSKNDFPVVLRLDMLARSVSVEVDARSN